MRKNLILSLKPTSKNVIPAKAGIQKLLIILDSRRSLPRTRIRGGSDKSGIIRGSLNLLVIVSFLVGCAGIPARKEVKVDSSLPVGKIEGNTFNGIRYPFKVSLPSSNWQFSPEIPDFMERLGFKRPGLFEVNAYGTGEMKE